MDAFYKKDFWDDLAIRQSIPGLSFESYGIKDENGHHSTHIGNDASLVVNRIHQTDLASSMVVDPLAVMNAD